jgi:hypothetical protein
MRVTELEQGQQSRRGLLVELLLADQQCPSRPIERVVTPATMAGLFGLHPSGEPGRVLDWQGR